MDLRKWLIKKGGSEQDEENSTKELNTNNNGTSFHK